MSTHEEEVSQGFSLFPPHDLLVSCKVVADDEDPVQSFEIVSFLVFNYSFLLVNYARDHRWVPLAEPPFFFRRNLQHLSHKFVDGLERVVDEGRLRKIENPFKLASKTSKIKD